MASHFECIGLSCEEFEFPHFLTQAVQGAQGCYPVEAGRYLRWQCPSGAEIWFQEDQDGEVIGAHPHFSGTAWMDVGLIRKFQREYESHLDGAFYAWASPEEDQPARGAYPFVFDLPDYLMCKSRQLPGCALVQIAAFAHEIELFDSPESYRAAQFDEELGFAVQSFVPSGLFGAAESEGQPPEASALLSGRVLLSGRKTNSLTGRPFHWAKLESYGGVFDIVYSAQEADVAPVGSIISGSFWLSGRLFLENPVEA